MISDQETISVKPGKYKVNIIFCECYIKVNCSHFAGNLPTTFTDP